MIFDVVERAHAVYDANFATDMAALVAAKGLTGIVTTATIIKRQTAEVIIAKRAAQPTIGIYLVNGRARAKDQGKRDSRIWLAVVYVASGSDPAAIGKQVELAIECILRGVDRMPGGSGEVYGAGVEDDSVEFEVTDYYTEGQAPNYYQVGTVQFPVDDREDGL